MLYQNPFFSGRILKKAVSAILAVLLVFSMLTVGFVFDAKVFALETHTEGDYTYVVLDDGTARITKYGGTAAEVTIPATLGGANVSEIGSEAFDNNDDLVEVTFPEGVVTIGNCAFRNCDCLETVNFSSTVTTIGQWSFEACRALQSIDIPSTVKTIDDRAFYNCPILTDITLHEGLEKMGNRFLAATPVASIYIPATVTYANEAFAEANNLYDVTFGDGITAIPNDMFEDNNSIRELTIPATVTKLGNDSLCQMRGLETIVIPDTVTEIGSYVLYQCTSLRSVTIGTGITAIPQYAFSGCTVLTEVNVPANVKTIGYGAFMDCSRLATVTLNEGLEDIGSYSFSRTALTSVTMPASVTKGSYPFDGCNSLKNIIFSEGVTTLVMGLYQNTAVESVTIPEGVTAIPSVLFKGCSKLAEVKLPSTLRTIGEWSFENCTSLTSIDIPASVKKICTRAFSGTTSLTTCTLHEGLQTMEGCVFYGSALTSIYIPKTLSASSSPFEGSNLTDVTFADGIAILPASLFCRAGKITKITIPSTVIKIGSNCFAYTNLESIVIPDTVRTIERSAFSDCDNLYAAKIGAGVRTIPQECFYGCDLLQSVIIPETVTEMGSSVFSKSGLSYLKIPQSITAIPYGTFNGCTNLVQVDCSDNLMAIGNYAFKDCVNFTTLNTPVESIDFNNSTFENCPKFTDTRFNVFNPAGTGIESTGNIGVDHTLVHFTVKYDIRDDWSDGDVVMKRLYLNLPNNLELVTSSFAAEGFDFDNEAYTGDYKSFSLSGAKTTGSLRFSAYINSSGDDLKNVSAEVEFDHKNVYFRKSVGQVQFTAAKLSLFAPSTVTDKTIVVSGYTASPDKDVKVYISHLKSDGTKDDTVTHTVTPNRYTGKYTSEALKILSDGKNAANEDMFEIYAECNGVRSDTLKFTYLPGAVRVVKAYETVNITRFSKPYEPDTSHGNQVNTYDITGVFTRGTSPVVLINPNEMLQFRIKLENDEDLNSVVLMSHKGNQWRFMPLHYDAKSDMWIGEGFFETPDYDPNNGRGYVPGALNLFYFYGDRQDTYRTYFYGAARAKDLASTGSISFGDLIDLLDDDDDEDDVFYYDKDGKPHGKLHDPGETIRGIGKDIFKDVITGDWKDIPKDITVGGLKSLWEWGNKDNNFFKLTHGGYYLGPDGLPVLPGDGDVYNRNADNDGKQRNAIDPSGVVYEAVKGNPVEGATATIYKFNEDNNEWEEWNAADYEQQNPLLTNNEGAYAWFTDEGKFKVTVSKEGYETQTSEEFDVPPEKLDLNFSLVDKTTHPTAQITKDALAGAYVIKFSKFMKPDTVTAQTLTIAGLTDVVITPVYLSEGDEYADTFTVKGKRTQSEVTVGVTTECKSYSGVAAAAASETFIEEDHILGDTDGDGEVTIIDATYIQRKLAGLPNQNEFVEAAADADGDGDFAILDATAIQRFLAGLPCNEAIGKPV